MNDIGRRILSRRTELGMTQEELASQIGADYQKIWRYENGKNSPSIEVLVEIAKALNTTPDWLLGFEDEELSQEERLLLSLYRAKDTAMRRKLVDIARIV